MEFTTVGDKQYLRVDKKDGKTKPPRIDIETKLIPEMLANLARWVCWRWELREGKWTKPPINARTGEEAKTNDPTTWTTYSEAMAAYRRNKEFAGIGFVFYPIDDIMGVDVDGCLNPDGTLTETGSQAVRHFGNSYCEVSPSGSGLKFIICATIPGEKSGRKNPKLDVEAYQSGRYFTVTGRRWPGSPSEILYKQDDLNQWFAEIFPDRGSADKKDKTTSTPVSAGVNVIVEKASAARNGDKFRQLWAGDCSEFGDDQSAADLSLCSLLAFWCGPDHGLIDDCFRASGLMRDKWEREDYRAGTIQKAIDGCSEFYKWDRPQTDIVISVPRSVGQEKSSVLFVPQSSSPEIQWPELIDLEEPPIDRLQPDLLPGWYGDMIRAVAISTETPVEMAALVALGAIATAIMRKYEILIESGFSQSLNLYLVSVMEPGNRKSAIFRALMAAVDQFERELRQAAIEIIKTAESQNQTWRKRIDDLRGKAAKSKNHSDFTRMQQEIEDLESQTPVVPPLPQLTADDATPESVCSLLAGNDERLTLSSAEPDLFDMMMGRYSSKPNLGIYLKGHDGDAHKENRKSGIPVSLSAPLLTICVMAQPEAVEDAGQQRVLKGRGLLARFLFVMPPSPVGYRDCVTRPIPRDVAQRYDDCLGRLLSVPVVKDKFDRPQTRLIRMSQEGHRRWKQEQLRIESDQRDGGRLSAFKDWAGKFPAAVARIAGNLHVANCIESGHSPDAVPIPPSTMATAIQFARVIESHTLKVFGAMNADENRKTAIKIIKTIRDERLQEITKRECMRADRTVDSALEIQPAIELLIRDGYLIPVDEDKRPGRPSEKYLINPAVHLKSDDVGSRDNTDKKDETPAGTEPAFNSVLFVPESDETEIEGSADDPVDDFEFTFASDGTPF